MTTEVCTCGLEEDVCEAQNAMARNQIRRIPVVDSQNKMVGILTMGDLAHNGRQLGEQDFSSTVENICDCNGNIKNCC